MVKVPPVISMLISSDFTPSLRDIFELESMSKPAKVMERLYVAEIGYEEVKKLWDGKFGAEVYEVFSSFGTLSSRLDSGFPR
jgi:anion-transporting  ArsA/GET3 family ATPase